MRSGTPGFQSKRLVEARDSKGLTQVALAELINRTSSSISRWEAGGQSPEPDALEDLAKALNLPVNFFLSPQPDHGPAPMFFRSMVSTTQFVRKRIKVRLRWAQNISLRLQEWVDLPPVNVPKFETDDHMKIHNEDIEQIADECRARWKLGKGPISDVLLVLENAGIVVVKEEVGTAKMDGVSHWSKADDRPYMLIAGDKATCVRSRMDAAHELGHLVLHRNLSDRVLNNADDFKEIERQAFHFASAFLMPAESFTSEFLSPSLNAFLAIKKRWKVSVGAMIKRCANLEIISEEQEYGRRLWKHYSARGWRKNEPFDDAMDLEEPRLLARAVRLLIDEGGKSKEDLLSDFRLYGFDTESLCGLPRGFMSTDEAEVVPLPTLKKTSSTPTSGANVIPLNKR